MHYSGTFWGYRELPPPMRGARRGIHPPMMDWSPRLKLWHWDLLGPIPYDYQVFYGVTTDDFPDDFVRARFQTRMLLGHVWDNPAELAFTYDGTEQLPTREFWYGFARLESVQGFKIRNRNPGLHSRYTLVFLR